MKLSGRGGENHSSYYIYDISSLRQRALYKEGIMILTGITGFVILIALLQVLLLPIANAQSSDSSVGAPGVYPARITYPLF